MNDEQWALFQKDSAMHVELVRSIAKRWLTWGNKARGGRVDCVMVQGLFPSFEAADDARNACRRAINEAHGSGQSALIMAKIAIKQSPGYAEPPRSGASGNER